MTDRPEISAAGRPGLPAMVREARSGILLVGLTPPRRSATPEKITEIAGVTLARLAPVDVDGLVLYDIDDESDRNPDERPFPYLPTMDPAVFHAEHLGGWDKSVVLYRCVGKYPETELTAWLRAADPERVVTVFVGSSSGEKPVHTPLDRAHSLREQTRPDLLLGGVSITERYTRRGDEHLRMLAKQRQGCQFFITQVVYDVDATKSMLSDYYYACAEQRTAPRPVILTLSVCGSMKTLSFLRWLGVDVPQWLQNTLRHSADPLTESYEQCVANARELAAFCRRLGIPFGFNVESVSIRRAEIEASMTLAAKIRDILDGPRGIDSRR